jgi:hypothetical protein
MPIPTIAISAAVRHHRPMTDRSLSTRAPPARALQHDGLRQEPVADDLGNRPRDSHHADDEGQEDDRGADAGPDEGHDVGHRDAVGADELRPPPRLVFGHGEDHRRRHQRPAEELLQRAAGLNQPRHGSETDERDHRVPPPVGPS